MSHDHSIAPVNSSYNLHLVTISETVSGEEGREGGIYIG